MTDQAPDRQALSAALADVRSRIARAAARAQRSPEEVTLLAVSKTQSADVVRAAYEAGQRSFGENYAQELEGKQAALASAPDLQWHFIGHLQTNKARLVAPRVSMVHTVDSERLARELARRCGVRAEPLDVLIEVNIGGESTKSGVEPSALESLASCIDRMPELRLRGLMCIPPPVEDPELARPAFRRVRTLRDEHGGQARWPVLSMGMTHDLEVAVEEGSTLVRVGTAIFGARQRAPKAPA